MNERALRPIGTASVFYGPLAGCAYDVVFFVGSTPPYWSTIVGIEPLTWLTLGDVFVTWTLLGIGVYPPFMVGRTDITGTPQIPQGAGKILLPPSRALVLRVGGATAVATNWLIHYAIYPDYM